jgi:formylmethanofuran dehydrogenase subunit D
MYLTETIYSSINRKKIYGEKGDKVTVKAYHGSVVTVEIKEKHGFSVLATQLSLTKR